MWYVYSEMHFFQKNFSDEFGKFFKRAIVKIRKKSEKKEKKNRKLKKLGKSVKFHMWC